jgi:hypothetical protein
MAEKKQYPSDKQDQFMLRLPDGLRDRIKTEAEKNKRSMNAEVVATLEQKYPPKTIDVRELAEFLSSLGQNEDPDEDRRYIEQLNDVFSKVEHPYTVRQSGTGEITFYPYATPKVSDRTDND